jgi:hypothetical protein
MGKAEGIFGSPSSPPHEIEQEQEAQPTIIAGEGSLKVDAIP